MMKKFLLLLFTMAALLLPAYATTNSIPQQSPVTSVTGSDQFFDWQGGALQQCTAAQMLAYIKSGLGFTLASGKTLTVDNTLTFTGTDGSSVAFGAGGTVLYTSGIGVSVQGYSSNLTTYAGITPGTGVASAMGDAVNASGGFITYSGIGGVVEAHSSALDALAALSPPSTSGYILASSSSGTLSWVPNSASTYTFSSGLQNSSGTVSVLYGTTAGTALQGNSIGSTVEAWSPVLDAFAAGTYTGSTSITTLGTITAGAVPWNLLTNVPITVTTGKSLSVSNTLTLAGTDGSTLNIGAGGTLGSAAFDAASAFDAAGSASTVQSASLQKSANLSDLANAATARTNLGLGSAATTSSSAYDASGAASTAQSNAEAYAGNASNLSSGTVGIGRLPTGTTSSTVALGNAPATAQSNAEAYAASNLSSFESALPYGAYGDSSQSTDFYGFSVYGNINDLQYNFYFSDCTPAPGTSAFPNGGPGVVIDVYDQQIWFSGDGGTTFQNYAAQFSNVPKVIRYSPSSGGTVTLTAILYGTNNNFTAYLTPSGTLSSVVLVFYPGYFDGQVLRVLSSQTISSLTITTSSCSVAHSATSIAANSGLNFIWDATATTWRQD